MRLRMYPCISVTDMALSVLERTLESSRKRLIIDVSFDYDAGAIPDTAYSTGNSLGSPLGDGSSITLLSPDPGDCTGPDSGAG